MPAELHVFKDGAHGTGLGQQDPALAVWPTLLANWLRAQRVLTADDSAGHEAVAARSAAEDRARCSSSRRRRSDRSRRPGARGRRAGVHRAGALSGARLDRVDAGLPVRLGAAAVRRDRRRARSSSSAARARVERMAPHLTHIGVHDHGFNNVSTYGNLWRLAREGRIDGQRVGAALLRAGAEGQRRGAGAALDAAARAAASSTRSTARIRCSSTRSARCARWRSATCSASG